MNKEKAINEVLGLFVELEALRRVYDTGLNMRKTSVVDDDFPEQMHYFDSALYAAKGVVWSNAPHSILADVIGEIKRAVEKFPTWPSDPIHAFAVLGEECGELNKAVLQAVYEPEKSYKDEVKKEAVQTAAMAIRFLLSLDIYNYEAGTQHEQ